MTRPSPRLALALASALVSAPKKGRYRLAVAVCPLTHLLGSPPGGSL
jgi:hypothetical protein